MADKAGSVAKVKIVPNSGPGRAGFAVDRADGRLKMRRGGTSALETIASDAVLNTSLAALTLKAKDDGTTVVSNNLTSGVFTLPPAKAGLVFNVVTGTVPTSNAGTTITPNAADKFQGNGFNSKTAGQTLVNTRATPALIGDAIQLIGTDQNVWFVLNKIGTWA